MPASLAEISLPPSVLTAGFSGSTTGTTFVDVDSTNGKVDYLTHGGDLIAFLFGTANNPSASVVAAATLNIDGSDDASAHNISEYPSNANFPAMFALVRRFTGLTPDTTHTIKARHRLTSATGTLSTNGFLYVVEARPGPFGGLHRRTHQASQNFLQHPPIASAFSGTSTVATYGDVDSTNGKITLTTLGGDLVCFYWGYSTSTSAVGVIGVQALALDGAAEVSAVSNYAYVGASGRPNCFFTMAKFTGLAPGSHTVKARHSGSVGSTLTTTGNLYAFEHRAA